jgi:hypothetical protein
MPDNLPDEANDALVRILPWCFLISGNLELTANALSFILGKEVTVQAFWQYRHHAEVIPFRLGNAELGADSVLGQHYTMPALHWHFTIHGLSAAERARYTKANPMGLLLDRFSDIFLPIHICTTFELTPSEELTNTNEEILGYGFVL